MPGCSYYHVTSHYNRSQVLRLNYHDLYLFHESKPRLVSFILKPFSPGSYVRYFALSLLRSFAFTPRPRAALFAEAETHR